jgi:hypothetical protein
MLSEDIPEIIDLQNDSDIVPTSQPTQDAVSVKVCTRLSITSLIVES